MILMKRKGHHGGTCSTGRQMAFELQSNKRKETCICLNSGPASFLSKRKNGFLRGMFWTKARSKTYRRFPKCALLPRKSWKTTLCPALKASGRALSTNPHHPLLTAQGWAPPRGEQDPPLCGTAGSPAKESACAVLVVFLRHMPHVTQKPQAHSNEEMGPMRSQALDNLPWGEKAPS